MKLKFITYITCFLLFSFAAQAGEMAYTVRPTEVKAKPFSDAKTLLKLAEHDKVEIMKRHASWMRVKTNKTTGWVKMLNLRLSSAEAPKKSSDNGLAALFNIAITGKSGSNVVTGVRGLSEENLKNAQPNPKALKTMRGYAVSAKTALRFAAKGHLKKQSMAYLPLSDKKEN
ncbi:MAG: SH3 domain-containing protein [Gallionella sp.]